MVVRRASATSASGTSKAAVAFAYVSADPARHRPCAGSPHGRTCNATPTHPVKATRTPTASTPPGSNSREAAPSRRLTDTTAAVPAPNSAQPSPLAGVPAAAARTSAQTASDRPANTNPVRRSAKGSTRATTAIATASVIMAATNHCTVLKNAPCPKAAAASAMSKSRPGHMSAT